MLARLAFYPTLLYNVVLEKLTSRQWYSRIDENIILGALPFRSTMKELVEKENVKAVVSMNEPYELYFFSPSTEEWRAAGVEHLQLSTRDLSPPALHQLQTGVRFIQAQVRDRSDVTVYVHCKAGRSRSTSLVACYLMTRHRWRPQQALDHIRARRPHVIILPSQQSVIREYYDQLDKCDVTTGNQTNTNPTDSQQAVKSHL